jgi:hypothetical protein
MGAEHCLLMHAIGATLTLPHQPRAMHDLDLFQEMDPELAPLTSRTADERMSAHRSIIDRLGLANNPLFALDWYDRSIASIQRHAIRYENGVVLSRALLHVGVTTDERQANVRIDIDVPAAPGCLPRVVLTSIIAIPHNAELVALQREPMNFARLHGALIRHLTRPVTSK